MKNLTITSAFKKLFGIAEKTIKQPSTSETDKRENEKELVQVLEIDDTPFTAAKYQGRWYLMLGRYRLTEELKTLNEAKEAAKDSSWFRIMQVAQIVAENAIDNRSKEVIVTGLDATIKAQQEAKEKYHDWKNGTKKDIQ